MPAANQEYLFAPAPEWLTLWFIGCTALAVWLLGRALGRVGLAGRWYWLLTASWLAVQAALAGSGFYQTNLGTLPPRLALGALVPVSVVILGVLLLPASRGWVARLSLSDLTALSIVRVGVEIGLYGLAASRLVPELMTFTGRNFDVVAGLTAPVVAYGYRQKKLGRKALLVWHGFSTLLLTIIVALALLAAPTPLQQLAFEQPNVAVLRFPFVWLPAFIVPVVLFSHLASFYQLLRPLQRRQGGSVAQVHSTISSPAF